MKFLSPLRYPGGKAILSNFLRAVIAENDLTGCRYFEPFAGGAGAALTLLESGDVSKISLNDADYRIYAFWHSALHQTAEFVERIFTIPLTITEWRRQHAICSSPEKHEVFEVGFAAFYMNRCNRSGVLTGAGPIGGYDQQSEWTISARFNRDTLSQRISHIGSLKSSIEIYNEDAIDFLKIALPSGLGRQKVFAYLDPPYVVKGQRLYLNAYDSDSHKALSKYILSQNALRWLMSYDDCELIRDLYETCEKASLEIRYSLQERKSGAELVISPHSLKLPRQYWNASRKSVSLSAA